LIDKFLNQCLEIDRLYPTRLLELILSLTIVTLFFSWSLPSFLELLFARKSSHLR